MGCSSSVPVANEPLPERADFDSLEKEINAVVKSPDRLWALWDQLDPQNQGKVGLSAIESFVAEKYPLLGNKAALARCYAHTVPSAAGGENTVERHEFRPMLLQLFYFHKAWSVLSVTGDGDRTVSRVEFAAALPAFSIKLQGKHADAEFTRLDSAGAGNLHLDVFSAWVATKKNSLASSGQAAAAPEAAKATAEAPAAAAETPAESPAAAPAPTAVTEAEAPATVAAVDDAPAPAPEYVEAHHQASAPAPAEHHHHAEPAAAEKTHHAESDAPAAEPRASVAVLQLDEPVAEKAAEEKKPALHSETFDALEKELFPIIADDAKLAALWSRLDGNGNGKVSVSELDAFVANNYPLLRSRPALMRAFKHTCSREGGGDGDDYVEKPEFKALLRNLFYFNRVWEAFAGADADGDRRLTQAELVAGLPKVGLHLDDEAAAAVFAEIDANGGGTVLFDEFCAWLIKKKATAD